MKRTFFPILYVVVCLLFFYGIGLFLRKGSLIAIVMIVISFLSGYLLYRLKSN